MQEEDEVFKKDYIQGLNHQTPYFIFSKKKIQENLENLKSLFPNSEIYYAMKANFEPEILKTLHEVGSNFEVATKYELQLIKELNVPAEKIIYGTAVKPADHIKDFYDYGVRIFACDYEPELEKIAKHAPNSKVYFRLNVSNDGSKINLSEKFGATRDEIISLAKRAKELDLEPHGISFHVGSDSSNVNSWADNLEVVNEIISEIKKHGIDLRIVNIGGGYPCGKYDCSPDQINIEHIAERTLKKKDDLNLEQEIILEPGRGLIADTGIAVASVIGKAVRGDKKWLFLDMGVYNGLFQATVGQEAKQFRVDTLKHSEEKDIFSLAGPTGDGPDVIRRDIELPKDLDVGDVIIFYDIGAYNLPTICNFHALPKPNIHLI